MLYFIATPIGNLKDVSYRAIETLNSVDVIACEDTRHSSIFLNNYNIKKPLFAYHKFNERESAENVVSLLKEGKNVAVISDAGTPIISDPGNTLCKVLIENELPFTTIPGACAFVPALILSGMDSSRFTFIGFLPEKKSDAQKLLEKYSALDSTLIFYCAPHDIDRVVSVLAEVLGNRKAVATRELTKLFEQRIEFNLQEGYNGEKRGEFVIVVEGKQEAEDFSNITLIDHVNLYIKAGLNKMDAIKQVAKERGVKKNELYKQIIDADGDK